MFIIICIFLGLALAIIMAPAMIIVNKKKLKEMDEKINKFDNMVFSTPEEKEMAKRQLKKELIKIKSGIMREKHSIEQARDKIDII